MHRKIWTKDESFSGVASEILFVILWYSTLLKPVIGRGSQGSMSMFPFLIAGLMPLYMAIRKIRQAVYYRGLHKKYMRGMPRKGKIINCQKRYYQERGSKGHISNRADYILVVEVYDNETFLPTQIQSEPYSWPVYKVLAAPEVDVYTDETGWHHIIDGFHYKKKKNEPDIFKENPFDESRWEGTGRFGEIIFCIFIIVILISHLIG